VLAPSGRFVVISCYRDTLPKAISKPKSSAGANDLSGDGSGVGSSGGGGDGAWALDPVEVVEVTFDDTELAGGAATPPMAVPSQVSASPAMCRGGDRAAAVGQFDDADDAEDAEGASAAATAKTPQPLQTPPPWGFDGYGGGRAAALAVVASCSGAVWEKPLRYTELKNPRVPAAAAAATKAAPSSATGGIAPQFEDICPTHYAVIVAERTSRRDFSTGSASSVGVHDGVANNFYGHADGGNDDARKDGNGCDDVVASALLQRYADDGVAAAWATAAEAASSDGDASVEDKGSSIRSSLGGEGTVARPVTCSVESSLVDYDDFYSGRLMGDGVPPPPHEAFLRYRPAADCPFTRTLHAARGAVLLALLVSLALGSQHPHVCSSPHLPSLFPRFLNGCCRQLGGA